MTTAELYSLFDEMERDRQESFAIIDRGTQRIINDLNFNNQWRSSSNLDTYGRSPEQLIRDVERKKEELDDLAEERQADFNRQIEEFKQEYEDNPYGNATAVIGQGIGTLSLEKQKRDAKKELDAQLTDAFEDIREEIYEDVDEKLDIAHEARAETLLPIEYDYYDDIITYYKNYKSKMRNNFSIKNTSWLYPGGSLPDKPRIPSNPSLTRSEAESFMETKYELVKIDDDYSDEAKRSLKQLSTYTTKNYPNSSMGFYYASLTNGDALDSYLLANRACTLNRSNYKYSNLKDEKWSNLNDTLFSELSRGRTSLAGRCDELDLLMQFRNSNDENPYIYALNNNVSVMDTLLGFVPASERYDLVQSLLYLAAGKGLNNRMETLVSRGADVNASNNQTGYTPFLIAADSGQKSTMGLFMNDYGIDIHSQLSRASRYGLDNAGNQTALLLLEEAYSEDEPEKLGQTVKLFPQSPYSGFDNENNWISASIANDKTNLLRAFFDSGLSPDSGDLKGNPALLVAMKSNSSDEIFSLLEENGTSFYPTLENGDTLLHWAIREDRQNVRDLWYARGMHGNIKNNQGKTALHVATEQGDSETVMFLLNKDSDPLLMDQDGRLALHYAGTELHGDTFDILLEASKGTDHPDNKGTTPLHLAIDGKDLENAEKLLAADPWIDQQDEKGKTYLLASMDSLPELFEVILEHNPDVNIIDDTGMTAMHRAFYNHDEDKLQALIPFEPNVNLADRDNKTVLALALQTEYPLWRSMLTSDSPDWNAQDSEGISPAYTLISLDTPDVLEWLEPGELNPNLITGTDETLLHAASRSGNSDVLESLLKTEPKENLINRQESLLGETPLHLAVRTGNLELVELLMDSAADPELENLNKQTPYDLAFDLGLPSIGSTIKYYGDEKKIASYNEKILKGNDAGMKDRNWAAISSFTVAGIGAAASTWFFVEGTNAYFEYQNNPYSSTMDSYRSAVESNSTMLGYSLAATAGGFVSGVLSIVIPKIIDNKKAKEAN